MLAKAVGPQHFHDRHISCMGFDVGAVRPALSFPPPLIASSYQQLYEWYPLLRHLAEANLNGDALRKQLHRPNPNQFAPGHRPSLFGLPARVALHFQIVYVPGQAKSPTHSERPHYAAHLGMVNHLFCCRKQHAGIWTRCSLAMRTPKRKVLARVAADGSV